MLSTNELKRVILHNDGVGYSYACNIFPGEDWIYLFGTENQVDTVMNDIQSISITKDPKIDE